MVPPGAFKSRMRCGTALIDQYDFAGPGTINVKGKGPSRTWFLTGRRSL